jgi:hypothetical protein
VVSVPVCGVYIIQSSTFVFESTHHISCIVFHSFNLNKAKFSHDIFIVLSHFCIGKSAFSPNFVSNSVLNASISNIYSHLSHSYDAASHFNQLSAHITISSLSTFLSHIIKLNLPLSVLLLVSNVKIVFAGTITFHSSSFDA